MVSPFINIAEPVSTLTHFAGALVGLAWARKLTRRGHDHERLCLWVFVLSAICLLTLSGGYHFFPRGSASRDVMQRFDHAGIFALIAGTFTAGHGIFFRGFWRSGVIALLWVLGLSGIFLKLVLFDQISEGTGLVLYLGMGWLGLALMTKLVLMGRWRSALYMLLGGVAYTTGALADHFMGPEWSLLPGVVGAHELFHLAVLGGIGIHWRLFHLVAGRPLRATPVLERAGAQMIATQ